MQHCNVPCHAYIHAHKPVKHGSKLPSPERTRTHDHMPRHTQVAHTNGHSSAHFMASLLSLAWQTHTHTTHTHRLVGRQHRLSPNPTCMSTRPCQLTQFHPPPQPCRMRCLQGVTAATAARRSHSGSSRQMLPWNGQLLSQPPTPSTQLLLLLLELGQQVAVPPKQSVLTRACSSSRFTPVQAEFVATKLQHAVAKRLDGVNSIGTGFK